MKRTPVLVVHLTETGTSVQFRGDLSIRGWEHLSSLVLRAALDEGVDLERVLEAVRVDEKYSKLPCLEPIILEGGVG